MGKGLRRGICSGNVFVCAGVHDTGEVGRLLGRDLV